MTLAEVRLARAWRDRSELGAVVAVSASALQQSSLFELTCLGFFVTGGGGERGESLLRDDDERRDTGFLGVFNFFWTLTPKMMC